MDPFKVGLLGLGTVGSGTFSVLQRNQEEIRRRAGRGIEITRIAVRDVARAKALISSAEQVQVGDDPFAVVDDPTLDIIVETIGGTTLARELVMRALANGKPVVTANKALLALHGTEIFEAAQAKNTVVAFEAAVAGGIPIIKALREGLTANRIQWIAGIINGTTNFILSQMRERSLDFAAALSEAQRLGYAEADPAFDVQGVDAAHKLTIMSAIAFGIPMQFERVHVEGIDTLATTDIRYAEELGYRIKLLGIARRRAAGIELRVHPALIPTQRLIANVEGAMNAVLVQGDAVGTTLYYGKGAGTEPTASSVVADLIDIARLYTADPEHRVPHLSFRPESLDAAPILPITEARCGYYLRLKVLNNIGVLADITRTLADAGVSIDALLQRKLPLAELGKGQQEPLDTNEIDVILTTHITTEKFIDAAIQHIEAFPAVRARVIKLRIEMLS